MTGLILLIVIGSTIWVGVDASGRDFSQSGVARSTAGWVLGSLLLWLVVFPLYIAQRSHVPLKGQHQPPAPSAGEARPTTDWLPPAASGHALAVVGTRTRDDRVGVQGLSGLRRVDPGRRAKVPLLRLDRERITPSSVSPP